VATGSITVPLVVGLAADVVDGVANIFVTGATSTSAANNTVLEDFTDGSGAGGTLSGTSPVWSVTAPSGTDFKGLAFAPVAQPGAETPEVPLALLLPLSAALVAGGSVVLRRRRRSVA
jgi:hypothetical protein